MKIGILLANGFEEGEALFLCDILRRAKLNVFLISTIEEQVVCGAHQVKVICDMLLSEEVKDFDMILLPGGLPGAENLKENPKVIELVQYFDEKKKKIGAICAAPIVLEEAGILKSRIITSYPGYVFKEAIYKEDAVVKDHNLITSRGPAFIMEFAFAIIECYGIDTQSIKEGMLYSV